jgi:type VI protein secretion system component VasF
LVINATLTSRYAFWRRALVQKKFLMTRRMLVMRQEIPTWLAVVIIVIVLVIAGAIYLWREKAQEQSLRELPLPMKEKMKSPGGPMTGPVPPR